MEGKYLKYKIKYLELKNIIGGAAPVKNINIIFKLFDKDKKLIYEKKINYEDMKKNRYRFSKRIQFNEFFNRRLS